MRNIKIISLILSIGLIFASSVSIASADTINNYTGYVDSASCQYLLQTYGTSSMMRGCTASNSVQISYPLYSNNYSGYSNYSPYNSQYGSYSPYNQYQYQYNYNPYPYNNQYGNSYNQYYSYPYPTYSQQPCTINNFNVSPSQAASYGQRASLSWSTSNCSSVSISGPNVYTNGSYSNLPSSGSITVYPNSSNSYYTLTATPYNTTYNTQYPYAYGQSTTRTVSVYLGNNY